MSQAPRQRRARVWPPLAIISAFLPRAAAAAGAPQLFSDAVPGTGYIVQLVVGLAVVLAGVAALAWLMRRLTRFQGAAGERLRVLGGVSVGARERVVLIQVGDEQLLVGVASGQVRMLHALRQPLPPSAPHAKGEGDGFARRLAQALGRPGSGR